MDHLFNAYESIPLTMVPLYVDTTDLLGYDCDHVADKCWDKDRLLSHGDLYGHNPPEAAAMGEDPRPER